MSGKGRHRIEPYLSRLLGYARSLSGSRDEARDLVQECVVKALSASRTPLEEPAYRAWLFRILRNNYVDRRRRKGLTLDSLDQAAPVPSVEIWRSDDHLLNRLTVRLAMAKLSPSHREIIALIDIVGLSYGEAAAFLSIPAGTVMSRLSRARQALLQLVVESNVRGLPQRASGDER